MSWHWLSHDWGKWEPYTQHFNMQDVRFPGQVVPQSRIRQKRTCAICGAMQDVVVAELYS